MKLVAALNKPQYALRPLQTLRRVWQSFEQDPSVAVTVRLPWGHAITVNPREDIGRLIRKQGIYDLVITEALWRLVSEGDRVLDVGANIGYTTSLMSARAGAGGEVLCFEPHPEIIKELEANVLAFTSSRNCATITLQPYAASDHDGESELVISEYFNVNRGTAKIGSTAPSGEKVIQRYAVRTSRLDSVLAPEKPIRVMKIDIEGHELPAFRGLGSWLTDGRIRDIVFEEHQAYPAATHQYLEGCGYTVFCLEESFWGLRLKPAGLPCFRRYYDTPSYLATCDPARARQVFSGRGWQSFRGL